MKKRFIVIFIGWLLVVVMFAGCALPTSESAKKHANLHLIKMYKDLVELHREVDWFFFDLDEEDPDLY
jgi:hypothetical protein